MNELFENLWEEHPRRGIESAKVLRWGLLVMLKERRR